jgi:pyruvate dehydrogenase E1 component beta subunit
MSTPEAKAMRQLKFHEAVNEAQDICLARDPAVYLMGLGVPDPGAIFGTTRGLREKHGPSRVMDMPVSECAMTGVALGSALTGMRPIMVHQRLDFSLYAIDQIVNQAANWQYMFAGSRSVPMVIRMVVGRGWGQGPQHAQSLQAWFSHIPGLKVVMPVTAHDAKGLLIAAVEDDNPVIFIEHRWLHNLIDFVPEGHYVTPIGKAHLPRTGNDLTIAATSYMVVEAIKAADIMGRNGVSVEVVDIRSLRPLDKETLLGSVRKTGRLLVADTAWITCGFGAEVVSVAAEEAFEHLIAPPRRMGLPACPCPTSPGLAKHYYPQVDDLLAAASEMLGLDSTRRPRAPQSTGVPLDVQDKSFTGPF